ncbi:MAG TPA: gephyrin-like molybdotransferase Glp, partial [Candidatus Dormibacteraeota bacterium]|nr:gephyrin-like molybdotransferase Glp [Candidatus Dormibacteraeota bacterium]
SGLPPRAGGGGQPTVSGPEASAPPAGLPGVDEARRAIVDRVAPLPAGPVAVGPALAGRVLREPLLAQVRLPPFDNSAMDGYAVRSAERPALPVTLPVTGAMQAGMAPGAVSVAPGTCAKVMTGAPLPAGADAVAPYEWTDRGASRVTIEQWPEAGHAVRRAGEDLVPGRLVLPEGRRVRAFELAACAATGMAEVAVGPRPRVALLTTGDELRPAGSALGPGQIYDTAGPAVEALVAEAGGTITHRGHLPDDPVAVQRALEELAGGVDCIVTVGAVSMGDHDHVRGAVEALGELHLWRVAMRPGRPVAFGHVRGTIFLGLPGNPVSACVTFLLFAAPVLWALQGAGRLEPDASAGVLLEDVEKPEGLETFHRCRLEPRPGGLPGVRLTGAQGSGITASLAGADALCALPAAGDHLAAGTPVRLLPISAACPA